MSVPSLGERFGLARRDPALAVLEGFHAVKHAVRFGAEIEELVTRDAAGVARLAERLAPDVVSRLAQAREIGDDAFASLAPVAPPSGLVAIARRRPGDLAEIVAAPEPAPVLVLESPRSPGNLGAAIRSAAAAGAAGVVTTGEADPWHPAAIRGAAGLQYAIPVARADELPPSTRPIIALHPEGEPLRPGGIPHRALLAFGSERAGLSDGLLQRASGRLSIPMRPGISSLNLGAAVAVTLYTWRLGSR